MTRVFGNRKIVLCACAGLLVVGGAGLGACAAKPNPGNPVPTAEKPAETPATDKFGIVDADSWKDIYPHQYASYLQNAEKTPPWSEYESAAAEDTTSAKPDGFQATDAGTADKLEAKPEMKSLGKGYGYAKYYTEPASHVYSLWTVTHNGRINDKTKTGCIACKSPQFSAQVEQEGDSIFTKSFYDYVGQYTENVSCASCHGNDPTELRVDRAQWRQVMANDTTASMEGQVCGQCHCDYSMYPGTNVPTSPYTDGRASMTPDKALAWYDANMPDGDWTYESTGAKMIAVRHAEYEFNYGGEGNHMTNLGYDCSDCHMSVKRADDGTAYTDHNWSSPTENDGLVSRDCSKCHKDLKAEVKAWQDEIDTRTHNLGLREEKATKNFEDAIAAGTLSDEQKARLQKIQRDAGYYWNLCTAENSKGAHNPTLFRETLAKGEQLMEEADQILGVSSQVS